MPTISIIYYVDWIRYWKWVVIFTISLDDGSASSKSTRRDYANSTVTNGLVSHLVFSCLSLLFLLSPKVTVGATLFAIIFLRRSPQRTSSVISLEDAKLMTSHIDFWNVKIDLNSLKRHQSRSKNKKRNAIKRMWITLGDRYRCFSKKFLEKN